jgi:NADPH2:quinone reductase
MRALLCTAWGGPRSLTLGDVASPEPGAGEVLIGVRACGLNFADTLMIQGKYQERPEFPFSPGLEVAGEVLGVGTGVEDLAAGDAVIAFCGHGGLAERVAVPALNVIPIPDGMEFATAAGFGVVYGTAHVGLERRGRLAAGEVLLVHGAAGGVGLAAVEVGRRMGATVIATAGSEEKLALAKAHGAHHAINYREEEFRERVKSLTQLPVNLTLVKNISVTGVYWGAYRRRDPAVLQQSWRQLLAWLEEGALSPHVSATYPLEDAPVALESLMQRRATGKVVVRIS